MRKSFVKWGGYFSIVSLLMFLLFASCSGGTDYVGTSSGGSGDYKITISTETKTGGTVTADKENAAEGDIVTLTVTPEPGYELDTLTVKDADGKAVAVSRVDGTAGDVLLMEAPVAGSTVTVAVVRYSFKMPKTNVTVSVTFKKSGTEKEKEPETVTYSVSIGEMTNGTVTAKVGGVEATQAVSGETVTLTATPSGTVRLKSLKIDGTEQVASVTAGTREFTFAMPAKNVTVTAEFGWIGTKEPSEAKAVGDIVFSDGSATPYADGLTLTAEQKEAAISVIFYAGTGLNSGDDTSTSRTLGVGLAQNQSGLAWCLESANANNTNITTIKCPASGSVGSLTFTGDRNGSDNLSQISAFLRNKSITDNTVTDDTATEASYPAFYFAKNYKSQTGSRVSGTDYESGWYLPSIAELFQIWTKRTELNKAIVLCAGTEFNLSEYYWSSSQYASYDISAYDLNFSDGDWNLNDKDYGTDEYVCAVRAF